MNPIWFENAKAFIESPMTDTAQRISDLEWISSRGQQWLDDTRVLGNDLSEYMARVLHRWFFEFADWTMLVPPKHQPIEAIRTFAVRLDGIVKHLPIGVDA
jgi:hypothetical protein